MTPAQFKTIRESCRLSVADFARLAKNPKTGLPVHERTVRNWEQGNFPIPCDVIDLLYDLEIKKENASHSLYLKIFKKNKGAVTLRRYKTNEELWQAKPEYKGLPAAFYGVIIYQAMELLLDREIQVTIDWA